MSEIVDKEGLRALASELASVVASKNELGGYAKKEDLNDLAKREELSELEEQFTNTLQNAGYVDIDEVKDYVESLEATASGGDLVDIAVTTEGGKVTKVQVVEDGIENALAKKANATDVDLALASKQAKLVSGTNIKTINGESILGSGDITIEGGGGSGDIDIDLSEYATKEELATELATKQDERIAMSLVPVGTKIPASANLNTIAYLKVGKYYCSLNNDAKTIKNCPTSGAFSMDVFNPLSTELDDETTKQYTYRLRRITEYNTGIQYVQHAYTNGTAGSWKYENWYVYPRSSFSLNSSKNDGSAALGSATKGVYLDSTGTFKAMSYTVGKNVPSNAVFTDASVTSAGNHYTPAEDSNAQIDAEGGEVTDITNSEGVQVVTGVKRDAKGHIVGVTSASLTAIASEGESVDLTDYLKGVEDAGEVDEVMVLSHYPVVNWANESDYAEIKPNTYYVVQWFDRGDLDIMLADETPNIVNEYVFEFTCAVGQSQSLILSEDIVWANDDVPEMKEGYKYVVSIIRNIACYMEVAI